MSILILISLSRHLHLIIFISEKSLKNVCVKKVNVNSVKAKNIRVRFNNETVNQGFIQFNLRNKRRFKIVNNKKSEIL